MCGDSIELSIFTESVLRSLIKTGVTNFICGFHREIQQATKRRLVNIVEININDNVFTFKSLMDDIETYRLVDIEGSITRYSIFDDLINDLYDRGVVFVDDLYDDIFCEIDLYTMTDVCLKECACGHCEQFICNMSKCKECEYVALNNISNCINDDREDEYDNSNIDELAIHIVVRDTFDDIEEPIFINDVSIMPSSLHIIKIKNKKQ